MNANFICQDAFAEEALFDKYRNMKSSGYLDNEYELTHDYREIPDHHLIKQDDKQFIELQLLLKNSVPLNSGLAPLNKTSDVFNKKINDILGSLDSLNPFMTIIKQKDIFLEVHRDISESQNLQVASDNIQEHSFDNRMQNLNIINTDKIKQKLKGRNKQKVVSKQIQISTDNLEKKQPANKKKRLNFEDFDY